MKLKFAAVAVAAACMFFVPVGNVSAAGSVHIVKSGDTLYKIAQNNGISLSKLESLNMQITDPSNIWIGEQVNLVVSQPTKADKLISIAKTYLGVPYVWAGASYSGVDCSGFTQQVFAKIGINLPHSAHMQADMGSWVSYNQLKEGDLVFFDNTYSNTFSNGVTHVGIYISNGNFIEASSNAGEVVIANLSNSFYQTHYYGAKRFL